MTEPPACPFCGGDGGAILWRGAHARVVLADEPQWPGLCRVVAREHAREMTDLDENAQREVLAAVLATERALREVLAPDKVNLASLGNVVPHVHWHVVPRWRDDACFPQSIWSQPVRAAAAHALPIDFAARVRAAVAATLGGAR